MPRSTSSTRRSRTQDQMIQAARSGKQNIIEVRMASATSKEMEIKLTNVARASLEELLADYRDFLRVRGLQEWPVEHANVSRLRELIRNPDASYAIFRKGIEHSDPAIAANVIIGLIRVANTLARPAASDPGTSLHQRRRPARADDAGSPRGTKKKSVITKSRLDGSRQPKADSLALDPVEEKELLQGIRELIRQALTTNLHRARIPGNVLLNEGEA